MSSRINITGLVVADGETLPYAAIYTSDEQGNVIQSASTISNIDGKYSINVEKQGYLSCSFVGKNKKTVKIDEICQNSNCVYDFDLSGSVGLPEFIIEGFKKKKKWWIGGLIGIVLLGGLVIYKLKNK
jgi:hypothetical protein